MPRGDQVARLYTLVMDLARSRRGLTAAALAQRHDRPLRTVYRDLDALEQAGFPITKLDGGRWKLIDGWDQKIPFPLTAGELLALHIAGDLMAPLAASPAGKQFAKLQQRLTGAKPRRRSGQAELFPAPPRALHLAVGVEIDYEPYADVIDALWESIEARRSVRGHYRAVTSAEQGWRTIDPYALHWDPKLGAMYVVGWCHARADLRTFAVHRFDRVETTEREFERPRDFDLDRYLEHSFGIWTAEETIDVRLLVHPPAAAWVRERRWHPTQSLREQPGGAVEVSMTVADSVEIIRWILGLGADVEVLAPLQLRDEIAEIHRLAASRGAAPAPRPVEQAPQPLRSTTRRRPSTAAKSAQRTRA